MGHSDPSLRPVPGLAPHELVLPQILSRHFGVHSIIHGSRPFSRVGPAFVPEQTAALQLAGRNHHTTSVLALHSTCVRRERELATSSSGALAV